MTKRKYFSRLGGHGSSSKLIHTDAEILMKEIPEDKRTPAERMLGDPIWERSALFRKQKSQVQVEQPLVDCLEGDRQ